MFDGKAFGLEVVSAVRAHVDKSMAPIVARIEAIERKLAEPAAVDGDDLDAVKSDVESLRKAIADLPAPVAPELPDIPAMIAEAVAAIPAPENGKDADPEVIRQMVAEAVAEVPPAKDGADADMEAVAAQVKELVDTTLAGWERPQDGKSVTVEELRPLVDESVQRAVSGLPVAKDGVNLAGAMIDRDGNLVLTLSDGTMKELGVVVGADGKGVDMAAVERSIVEKVAAIPKPKDGTDGVGFDDMDLVETDEGIVLRFTKGDVVKDFRLPVVIDRGVWKEGAYRKGDGCTWGGSFWICQEDGATDKPDAGKSWRLAVKRGRDGKDGVMKAETPKTPIKVG